MFKKVMKVLLIILLVILIAVAGIVVWQYDNITAFIDGVRYTEEQIDGKVEQSQQNIIDTMEGSNLKPPRAPTDEESQALTNGELTQEQFTKILTGQTTLEEIREENKANEQQETDTGKDNGKETTPDKPSDEGTNKPEQNPEKEPVKDPVKEPVKEPEKKPEQKPDDNNDQPQQPVDYDTLISEKVAELYAVKASYYAEFNDYWASAKAEFLARPVEEHTQANVAAVVKANMSKGLAMEARYDEKVDVIVSELTALLKEAGRDTKLATTVKNAYETEKKAEKARIVAKYFG